jgi:hypothetical protein
MLEMAENTERKDIPEINLSYTKNYPELSSPPFCHVSIPGTGVSFPIYLKTMKFNDTPRGK